MMKFTKMQGLGNDFMVVDGIHQTVNLSKSQIAQYSDRHFGVGFDQLLLIEKSTDPAADFNYRIFNADGQEVGQCGNGARCVALFIWENHLSDKDCLTLATQKGQLSVQREKENDITANMGIPSQVCSYFDRAIDLELFTVDIGNPHLVCFGEPIEIERMVELGDYFNHHPNFKEGVNFSVATRLQANHLSLTVYERGVGITLACGSGACAAVVVGCEQKKLKEKTRVSLQGGDLLIRWAGYPHPVFMTGPAVTVYQGEIVTSSNSQFE